MSAGDSIATICNRALAEIGSRSKLAALSDATPQANACSLFYDPLRKMLLRAAHWNFAKQQTNLTLLGTLSAGTAPFPWQFKYAYPSDCLKLRYILQPPPADGAVIPSDGTMFYSPWIFPSRDNTFAVASDFDENNNRRNVIDTNVCQALGVYTGDVTDPDLFDPLFTEALVASLALKLVIPMSGNVGMKQAWMALARDAVESARASDGNEAMPRVDTVPDWIEARGIPSPFYGWGNGTWWSSWDNLSWGE